MRHHRLLRDLLHSQFALFKWIVAQVAEEVEMSKLQTPNNIFYFRRISIYFVIFVNNIYIIFKINAVGIERLLMLYKLNYIIVNCKQWQAMNCNESNFLQQNLHVIQNNGKFTILQSKIWILNFRYLRHYAIGFPQISKQDFALTCCIVIVNAEFRHRHLRIFSE